MILYFLRHASAGESMREGALPGTLYGHLVVIYVVLRARTDWASRSGRVLRRGIWRGVQNAARRS